MARTDLLSDEVWAQLSPSDARLTRLGRRQLALAAVALIILASLAAFVQLSGLLTPQLTTGSSSGSAGGRRFTQSVEIENNGWFDEHISAIDSSARGAQVVSTEGVGEVIPPDASITIKVSYRMLSCSDVRAGDSAPIHLRIHRPWGISTLTVQSGGNSAVLGWVACGHAPR